jgi:hypothetical protein
MSDCERIRKEIVQELTAAKNDIVGRMKTRLENAFGILTKECRKVPLLCIAMGLSRTFRGRGITVRRARGPSSAKPSLAKRPSIVLQVENQSFIFDGRKFKGTDGSIGSEYKGMFREINDVLKKHIGRL